MSDHYAGTSNSSIENAEHDKELEAKRITDVGSDDQTLIDEAVTGTTYVGRAGRGVATTDGGWLLTKIVESGTDTIITHAIDKWSVRNTTASYS